MDKITALRDEFAKVHKEAGDVIAKGTEVTPEEVAANEVRFARMASIKTVLDSDKKLAEFAFSNTPEKITKSEEPEGFSEKKHVEIKVREKFDSNMSAESFGKILKDDAGMKHEFGMALTNWGRTGEMDKRFATITTATQSGIFLPVGVLVPFVGAATNAFREIYAGWGQSPMSTDGDTSTFNLPVVDAIAGGLVADNASSETDGTPTLTDSIVSTVKTYQSGSVYFSNLQLSATKFDLIGASLPALNYGKELGLESAMVAAIIADAGVTQKTITTTSTGFTFTNLATHDNSLPKRYANQKGWILGQAAYSAGEGLANSQGAPIMVPDPQNGNLKRIFGSPVARSDYFNAFGINNVIGIVFSLNAFHMRDAGVYAQRYNQVPGKPNQTGINVFGYHAYGYAKASVSKLVCAAS